MHPQLAPIEHEPVRRAAEIGIRFPAGFGTILVANVSSGGGVMPVLSIYSKHPREWSRYTLPKPPCILDIPRTTLHHRCRGNQVHLSNSQVRPYRPLIDVAHYDPKKPSMSYFNSVEVHVLSATDIVSGHRCSAFGRLSTG